MKNVFLVLLAVLKLLDLSGQDKGIDQWASYFSYNNAKSVAYGNSTIFAGDRNLFAYSLTEKDYSIYSKLNGLSDVGIKLLRWNVAEDYLMIIYENSNIDILRDGVFSNIPDIKNVTVNGSKRINDVHFYNGLAYLASDFGIVVLNPDKLETKETYTIQNGAQLVAVDGFCQHQGFFYAATDFGLYRADENEAVLQDFSKWSQVDGTPLNFVYELNDKLFLIADKIIYEWDTNSQSADSLNSATDQIIRIGEGQDHLYICENGTSSSKIYQMDDQGDFLDSYQFIYPLDVVEVGSTLWEADGYRGLQYLPNQNERIPFQPSGPYSNSTYNLDYSNGKIWVSGGGHTEWTYRFSSDGFSSYDYSDWTWYNRFDPNKIQAMDSVFDIMSVLSNPIDGSLYAASFGGGLLEIQANGDKLVHKANGFISNALGDPSSNRIAGLALDEDGNLWMSNFGATHQLVVKKKDGSWNKFVLPYPSNASEKTAGELIIDDLNQIWMIAPNGLGLFVFNHGGTIDVLSDDQARYIKTGAGLGNLPNNYVNSLALDKDGSIWVGTNDGIAIFNCAQDIFTGCDADLKIVKYDANPGLLFQSEIVRSIAVDGANNKWIGTNNGVWQISEDGETILKQFNVNNSPLPSNEITKIVIHPKTGDVFIGTELGLVSYRSTATEAEETNEGLLIFPNPVASTYSGQIAISGLVENADVRITDVSGQLVYRTKAQGGTATWNGKNYLGQKPMTGVYYVFVTNNDGTETKVGKLIFEE